MFSGRPAQGFVSPGKEGTTSANAREASQEDIAREVKQYFFTVVLNRNSLDNRLFKWDASEIGPLGIYAYIYVYRLK